MSLKGNKGEWSELYAFFKIVSDGRIYAADQGLNKLEDVFYPVLKVTRNESASVKYYELLADGMVRISRSETEVALVNVSDLRDGVARIFKRIKDSKETTFEIIEAQELINRFHVLSLNAGNSRKEDIVLKIHDGNTQMDQDLGFSIKSMVGSPATLLNASGATNFIFKLTGLNTSDIARINSMDSRSKARDRFSAILTSRASIEFSGIESKVFEKNLRTVDTILPEIVAEILLAFYSGRATSMSNLVEYVSTHNPQILHFDLDQSDLEYKVKALLHNVALGMVPNTRWDGRLRAHGGNIIVKNDGEIVCYHVFNADDFRSYLFSHTKLETPSTTRHEFGTIYQKDGDCFMKLNFQIRFI